MCGDYKEEGGQGRQSGGRMVLHMQGGIIKKPEKEEWQGGRWLGGIGQGGRGQGGIGQGGRG